MAITEASTEISAEVSAEISEAGTPEAEPSEPIGPDDAIVLDGDYEPSMFESLRLHVFEVHGVAGALVMDDKDLVDRHAAAHKSTVAKHEAHKLDVLSFRPGKILDMINLDDARRRALITPAQAVPAPRDEPE